VALVADQVPSLFALFQWSRTRRLLPPYVQLALGWLPAYHHWGQALVAISCNSGLSTVSSTSMKPRCAPTSRAADESARIAVARSAGLIVMLHRYWFETA